MRRRLKYRRDPWCEKGKLWKPPPPPPETNVCLQIAVRNSLRKRRREENENWREKEFNDKERLSIRFSVHSSIPGFQLRVPFLRRCVLLLLFFFLFSPFSPLTSSSSALFHTQHHPLACRSFCPSFTTKWLHYHHHLPCLKPSS